MAGSLFAVLLMAKVIMLWGRPIRWDDWTIVGYFWQDAMVALVFAAIAAATERVHGGRMVVAPLYWAIVVFVAINVPVSRVLSTPLTLPMLRATRGALLDSIAAHVSLAHVISVMLILSTAALLPRTARFRPRVGPAVFGAIVVCLLVAGVVAAARTDTAGLHRSALPTLVASVLPRIAARAGDGEWATPPLASPAGDGLAGLRGIAAGRHVVVVSLESTAAQYLRLYGGADDLTPRLDELEKSAVVFDSAYAVSPDSIRGLFSVLCSQFPAFDTPAGAYATAACPSIASTVASEGYRTAMFHSGRFGYLGMDAVIRGRGFDLLEDAGDIGGERESSFGVDEPATVERMLEWIDTVPPGDRFFLTYLPIAAHHPYATPTPGPFHADDARGDYRNAIHYGDASLGTLMDGFRARGLDNQILWIVFGDHGEAFGQHEGNHGHTFFLYDENVRVPFIVAAPGAIDGPLRSRTILSLVDTAPTVLDLLGIQRPDGYQGRSALDGDSRMALFFTDYSLSLVGLRDGQWKFVHEIESGRSKLFDLSGDPSEQADVAPQHASRVAAYTSRLKAWSAGQKERMRRQPQRAR